MPPDDDSDLRALEAGPPIDWTISYDRFQWIAAVRDHVFHLFAEPWARLSASRNPRDRAMAKRMHQQNDCLHRLFALAGFPREIWMRVHAPSPPWRCAEPPPIGDGVYAPWPPLEWESFMDRERWWWRLDGLCEHLASLALHVLGDRDHTLRLRIEWTLSRLRSHLVSARPRYVGAPPVPELEQVPPLAFWVGWPSSSEPRA